MRATVLGASSGYVSISIVPFAVSSTMTGPAPGDFCCALTAGRESATGVSTAATTPLPSQPSPPPVFPPPAPPLPAFVPPTSGQPPPSPHRGHRGYPGRQTFCPHVTRYRLTSGHHRRATAL